jgi:hypothetical protein
MHAPRIRNASGVVGSVDQRGRISRFGRDAYRLRRLKRVRWGTFGQAMGKPSSPPWILSGLRGACPGSRRFVLARVAGPREDCGPEERGRQSEGERKHRPSYDSATRLGCQPLHSASVAPCDLPRLEPSIAESAASPTGLSIRGALANARAARVLSVTCPRHARCERGRGHAIFPATGVARTQRA